jgi:hypothetical protein
MLNEIAPQQELENMLKGGISTDVGNPDDVMSTTMDGLINSIEKLAIPALTALAAAATLAATGVGRLGLGGLFSRGAGAAAGAAGGAATGMLGRIGAMGRAVVPYAGHAAGVIGGVAAGYNQYSDDRAAGLSKSTAQKNAVIVGGGTAAGGIAGALASAQAGALAGAIIGGPIGVAVGGAIGLTFATLGALAGNMVAKWFTQKKTEAQKNDDRLARIEETAQLSRIARMNAAYDTHISHITTPTPSKGFFAGGFDIRQGSSTQRGEVKHSGGIVGKGSARLIPRFHSGYMPDEVPAILQRGEAVLSRTQLTGLTNIMNVVQSLGKIGDSFAKIKVDALDKVSGTVGKLTGTFNSIKGMFSKSGEKGGGKGEGISSKLQGMFSGKSESGGIIGSLKNKAKSFISGKAGGILSKFTGNASTNSAVASLTGGKSLKSTALGMLKNTGIGKKVMGIGGGLVSKFATGKLGSTVLNKIPGAGIIGSLFKKGDKKKNVAKAAGSAVAGKLIGSAIGSVIPGAGTIVGGLVGSVAGKLVGKALGGLFKKKKKAAAPIQPPIVAQSDSDEGYTAVSGTGTNGQPVAPTVNVDLKPVEQQLQQLIMLMQNGGIVVNLDGKKVGGGLTDAFSRG